MIKVRKTMPAPIALQKSHEAMAALINDILKKKKVVVLSTKGSKGAKQSALPANAVKVLIDDEQYKPDQAKALLKTDQYGKCAFCEARFMDTAGGDVEHFRPKKRRDGFVPLQGEAIKNLGYFQYVYDWNNHLLSCKECNQAHKKNYFDHMPDNDLPPDEEDFATADEFWAAIEQWGHHKPAVTDDHDMAGTVVEKPVLINPLTENPREFINFNVNTAEAFGCMLDDNNEDMSSGNVSARGGKSILVLGLNRKELVFARARHLVLLRGVFIDMTRNLDKAKEFLIWQRGATWADTAAVSTFRQKVHKPVEWKVRDDPQHSSLDFLIYSTTPRAAFSALAQDAMAVWGKELCLHMIEPQQHFTQLQQADTGNPLATRSVNNLLSMSMHSVILNAYLSDCKAIAELTVVVERFDTLWSLGLEQSQIEFVCRKRLHEVMKLHDSFNKIYVSLGEFATVAYTDAWFTHWNEILEVENALRAYECDSKKWCSAIEVMYANMTEYSVDLTYELIPHANIQLTHLTTIVRALQINRELAVDPHFRDYFRQCMVATQQLSRELAWRIDQCQDQYIKDAANPLNDQLILMLKTLAELDKGNLPVDLPSLIEVDSPIPWNIPVATKVTKVPDDYIPAWNHIKHNSSAHTR